MSTVAATPGRTRIAVRIHLRLSTWKLVFGSRLLVLGAGVASALLTARAHGWTAYDAHHLSSSLGSVGNVLAAASVRWDAIRYVQIAQHGYLTAAQTVSFPFYSILIRALTFVIPSAVVAGVLISVTAFIASLMMLRTIVAEEVNGKVADATILLLAFAPMSFFFTAVYTESLFMALSVGCFYLARRQRFTLACVAAAAAAVTHVDGVLLVAPLAVMWWRSQDRPTSLRQLKLASVLPIAMPPVALAGFFIYLRAQGYGWLAPISNANKANYERAMVGTPVAVWEAIKAGVSGLRWTLRGVHPIIPTVWGPFSIQFQNLVYLVVLMISVLALISAWRRLPKEYAIFAGLVMIVCTSSAGTGLPLLGYDRYVLPVFPLWIGAAAWLQERRLLPGVLVLSGIALSFYSFEFARWVFVA